jgi:hypothetical protein
VLLSVACMVALYVSPIRLMAVGLSLVMLTANFLFTAFAALAFFLPFLELTQKLSGCPGGS